MDSKQVERLEEHREGFANRLAELDRIRMRRFGLCSDAINTLVHRYENRYWSEEAIEGEWDEAKAWGYLEALEDLVDHLCRLNCFQVDQLKELVKFELDELLETEKTEEGSDDGDQA